MRIGIDCRLWGETGVGRYIRNLVLNLQKIDRKNEYILFVLPKDYGKFKVQSFPPQRDPAGGGPKFKVKAADIRWHTINEQLDFPQILNRENLDLVHFPYFSVPIFYNRPFVVTIHDLIMHHFPTGHASTHSSLIYKMKLLGYKYVISRAARKAKKIIAVSKATKDEIIDHLKVDGGKIVVTYEGVESSKLKASRLSGIPQAAGQSSKLQFKAQKYFLYVGNAYPHKNLDRLLEAFKVLNNDAKLVLVGKEDYFYKRLREKVREMDLNKKVIFFGQATDEELASLYTNALAFVTPSLMEGFGLPALEAMANKCLVLASDIPALREVCADAAIYFDLYNSEDITEKMRRVYFNDLNQFSEKIKRGAERVGLFSWRKMAEQTLKVYEQAISNS